MKLHHNGIIRQDQISNIRLTCSCRSSGPLFLFFETKSPFTRFHLSLAIRPNMKQAAVLVVLGSLASVQAVASPQPNVSVPAMLLHWSVALIEQCPDMGASGRRPGAARRL